MYTMHRTGKVSGFYSKLIRKSFQTRFARGLFLSSYISFPDMRVAYYILRRKLVRRAGAERLDKSEALNGRLAGLDRRLVFFSSFSPERECKDWGHTRM